MLTLLFDGVAYGMLLFILAVGLCVTMGLMNFINLARLPCWEAMSPWR
jgi:branched-chain amino acid transport system permease protein